MDPFLRPTRTARAPGSTWKPILGLRKLEKQAAESPTIIGTGRNPAANLEKREFPPSGTTVDTTAVLRRRDACHQETRTAVVALRTVDTQDADRHPTAVPGVDPLRLTAGTAAATAAGARLLSQPSRLNFLAWQTNPSNPNRCPRSESRSKESRLLPRSGKEKLAAPLVYVIV